MQYADFGKKLETINAIHMTPFINETKEIDWVGLEQNINFLIEHGLKVIVTGNTSEFYALTLEEAKAVIEKVVAIVNGRATVMIGIGYSVETAIELGRHAEKAGADCVMIHQPIHPYITDRGATTYFRNVINALNIPSIVYFKNPFLSDEVIRQLAPLEKFVGVKYAINDLPRFAKLVRETPAEHNITWICGTAEKWAPFFFSAGATGFTSGLINVYPQKSFEMLNALKTGDASKVWQVWEELLPIEDLRAKYNNGNNVVVLKEAMEQLGYRAGNPREPVDPLNEQDKLAVTEILKGWGLI